MKLYTAKPATLEDRLDKEIRVYDLLDMLKIKYSRVDHKEAETIKDCEEIEKILEVSICKNLFLCNRQKTQFYLLMMPGDKTFKTKELSSQIGSARLSFASAEDMEKYLDIVPGSVSIMGLMNDKENGVQLLVDEDILNWEFVGCHPCVNTTSLKIKVEELFDKFLKAVNHDMVTVKLIGDESRQ